MKQYLIIIMAAVLLGTMASSCGKKTDEANMANKDSVATTATETTPSPSVTLSSATMKNTNTPGLYITGTNATTATITVKDTSETTTYRWRAYYGATNNSTLTAGNASGGNSATWDPGSYNDTTYWFPQYTTSVEPVPPNSAWVNFSSINIKTSSGTTDTAYAIVNGNSNANIRIVIQGGGGEPGK